MAQQQQSPQLHPLFRQKPMFQPLKLQVVALQQLDILTTSTFTTTKASKFQTSFSMSPWESLDNKDGTITSVPTNP